MNKHKTVIDTWLEEVRGKWLGMKDEAVLRRSTSNLLRQVNERCKDHTQFDAAWQHIDKLEQLLGRFHDDGNVHIKEVPQSYIDCGVAAYHMGNISRSIRFINVAIARYTDQHEKAVSHWLLGCMYWCLENSVEAIAEWENSLNLFEEQSKKTQKNATLKIFYQEKTRGMERAIDSAVKNNKPPNYAVIFPASQNSSELEIKPFVTSIPVVGEIPAGVPLGILPDADDYLRTQIFSLNESSTEFNVRSLILGQRDIRLHQLQEYFILRVKGDSMNLATPETILDGDYVLLKKQKTAENGDIVAAEITTSDAKDDRATLKRFKRKNNKILLIPESLDPKFADPIYVDKEYDEIDEGFYIRGIALAVFKKILG